MSEPSADSPSPVAAPQPPRLLDQLRQAALAHFGRPEPGQRFLHVQPGELPFPEPPRLLGRFRGVWSRRRCRRPFPSVQAR